MEVRIRPELANLVKQDVERGSYASVDEYVERAVSMLHDQEVWLAANRNHINAKIAEGYVSAKRGDLLNAKEVRRKLSERKQAHRKNR